MDSVVAQKAPRSRVALSAGVFTWLVFFLSGVTAAVASLASISYLAYLILVRTAFFEALTTVAYMSMGIGVLSLAGAIAKRISDACFSAAVNTQPASQG